MLSNVVKRPSKAEVKHFIVNGPWGDPLTDAQLELVVENSVVQVVEQGENAINAYTPAEFWVGVFSGLLEQVITSEDGKQTVISVAGEGAWFGEGTLLKSEKWQYNVVALKRARLVLVPKAVFENLRQTNIAFNHYLTDLLNHRLGLFIGMLINDRLKSPNIRLARNLAAMRHSQVYRSEEHDLLPVNQGTLALLCGLSRQRTNMGLQELQRRGLIRLRNTGTQILDVEGLSNYFDKNES